MLLHGCTLRDCIRALVCKYCNYLDIVVQAVQNIAAKSTKFVALEIMEVVAKIMAVMFPFWTTICQNGSLYAIGSFSCLSVLSVCLSVTLVYCGQTAAWIKMKFGMQVGLSPGHIVLDGDPSPPKGA